MTKDSPMIDQLWPMCAVCNKPVEKLEVYDDFATLTKVFIAQCHGAQDRCAIDKEILIFNKIMPGYAFVMPQIEQQLKDIQMIINKAKNESQKN